MKRTLSHFFSDYGMMVVLLLLCAFFSVVTLTEQSPTGEAAAKQVLAIIQQQSGKSARVIVAASDQPDDAAFAAKLERDLAASGGGVVTVVKGEPKDAREALQEIALSGRKVHSIACTKETGAWLVFADLKTDFPALGEPRVITPRSYRWPNFLKTENLLNIANQIAVIAIVAIGMTLSLIHISEPTRQP
jgi:ribose transport system permease protein